MLSVENKFFIFHFNFSLTRLPDPNIYNDPIRFFRDCHALIVQVINQLELLISDAEKKGIRFSIQEDKGWRDILDFLVNVAPVHEADEEEALFPVISEKIPHVGFQSNSSPIRFIQDQHEVMQAHATDLLRFWQQTLVKNEITDTEVNQFILGAKELAAIFREHIRRENEVIYTAANDELLSPEERQQIMETIREHHSKEVISGYFEYEAPVFSDPAFNPIYVAGDRHDDAIADEELEEDEEYEDDDDE
jgi:hemerythrin-like domain-containing protein